MNSINQSTIALWAKAQLLGSSKSAVRLAFDTRSQKHKDFAMALIDIKMKDTYREWNVETGRAMNQTKSTAEQHKRHILDLGLFKIRATTLGHLWNEVKDLEVRS